MFDYLIEDNNLMPVLAALGNINADDILFIKECIAGPIDEQTGLPMKNLSKDGKFRFQHYFSYIQSWTFACIPILFFNSSCALNCLY